MTVTVKQTALANTEKRAFSFLEPLSISFSPSCSPASQYSLKSFRGTSEAFVKCICIQCVISWKMPSLLFCFFIYLKDKTYMYRCRRSDTCKCHISPTLKAIWSAAFLSLYSILSYVCIPREKYIYGNSDCKWNTKILMYLDNDIHGGLLVNHPAWLVI